MATADEGCGDSRLSGPRRAPRAPKRASRDVFVFFDNDAKARAPFDAQGLVRRIERAWG